MLRIFIWLFVCRVHLSKATSSFVSLPALLDLPAIQKAVSTESGLYSQCRLQMERFLNGLAIKGQANQSDTEWAQIMWDASGRYMGSLGWGSSFWLGSHSQCMELGEGRSTSAPFPITYYISKLQLHLTDFKQTRPVSVGVCWPSSCTSQAVSELLMSATKGAGVILGTRAVPGKPDFKMWMEPTFYLLLFAGLLMGLMVVIGTCYYETIRRRQRQEQQKLEAKQRDAIAAVAAAAAACCDSLDMTIPESDFSECNGNHLSYTSHGPTFAIKNEPFTLSTLHSGQEIATHRRQKKRLLPDIFLGCAIQTSLSKICSSAKEEPLGCIHGLRVFSLVWVIAGHACMFAFPFADNRKFRELVERDFLFQSISNGGFSVDTFFVISGLLIAYIYFKKAAKKQSENTRIGTALSASSDSSSSPTSSVVKQKTSWWFSAVKKPILDFIAVISYRLLRLTPPYLIVLGMVELTTKWFHFNSIFDPPTLDHENCPKYWWRNILYINTLFPVKNMCMIWSWYLSNDTQFYILGIILLMISSRSFRLAVASLFGFLVCSWLTTGIIVINTNHVPSIEEPLGLFDEIYDKPWTRLAPYLIGMATGYFLQKNNCHLKIHRGWVTLGWTLCLTMTFILVHGLYGRLGPIASAAYATLCHSAWGLCVAWIIIACTTGHGGMFNTILSSRMMQPLSRITYCAYLLHPLIMISVIMHMDAPIHLGRDTMIITILGFIASSYLFSMLFSVIFEAPVIAILNILHPIKRKVYLQS